MRWGKAGRLIKRAPGWLPYTGGRVRCERETERIAKNESMHTRKYIEGGELLNEEKYVWYSMIKFQVKKKLHITLKVFLSCASTCIPEPVFADSCLVASLTSVFS